MANKTGGLGRGLGALGLETNLEKEKQMGNSLQISIYDIDTNPKQPRKSFDEKSLEELAESIRLHGIVQPILVKQRGNRFLIVAGERRFRAAKKAGFDKIPIILTELDEKEIAEVSLIENIQREDLNPIEEAAAIKFLMDQHDLTQEEVSKRVGKSRSAISNSIRLLELSEKVLESVQKGKISAGHGKMLAGIEDKREQEYIAVKAEKEAWSVRQLEAYLRTREQEKLPVPIKEKAKSAEAQDIERKLCDKYKTLVSIKGKATKGKIELCYSSAEELERILELLL